jgi:parallel beta-helix repeat protein
MLNKNIVFAFAILLVSAGKAYPQSLSNCPSNHEVTDCCILSDSSATYTLMNDLTLQERSACFHFNYGQDKILDLSGHTITYDTWPVVEVSNPSFESGTGSQASNWIFSNPSSAARTNNKRFWRFGGDYTLLFPEGAPAQYVESDAITLPANVNYRANFLYFGDSTRVYMDITGVAGSCGSPTNRKPGPPSHWYYYSCDFTPTSDATAKIRIGINGAPSSDVIIDMVELRPIGFNLITSVSGTAGLEIRNGNIVQGNAKSFNGAAVALTVASGSSRAKIHGLNISTKGTGTIPVTVGSANGIEIYENTFSTSATYNRDREVMTPVLEVHNSTNFLIHNNLVTGAYQTGIKVIDTDGATVHDNTVQIDSRLTNGYAIEAYRSDNVTIYNNSLSGNGRGMHIGGGTGAEVYGNTVSVREFINPEYPNPFNVGMQGNCTHGIKAEGRENGHIYNNSSTVYAEENTYVACPMNVSEALNVLIENNEFRAISSSAPGEFFSSAALYILGADASSNLTIRNNAFYSNESGVYVADTFNIQMDSNTMIYTGSTPVDFHAVYVSGWPALTLTNLDLLNNNIINAGADHPGIAWDGSSGWNYTVSWPLEIRVQDGSSAPIANATVKVDDGSLSEVYSGTTGPSGIIDLELPQYEVTGQANKNFYKVSSAPYSITVTTDDGSKNQSVALTEATAVTFEFSAVADVTPPDPITDLGIMPCSANSCTISWTAPGDNHLQGRAATYDIRYSTAAIDASNWDSAVSVPSEPFPASSGTKQSMIILGLAGDTTYYFAIKTADEVPNWSGVSNIISGTTNASNDPVWPSTDDPLDPGLNNDDREDGFTVSGGCGYIYSQKAENCSGSLILILFAVGLTIVTLKKRLR